MIRYEDIEPYLLDYLQGKAEEATEYRIKAYLQQNPDFQHELDELEETLNFIAHSPLAEPEPALKMNFYAMLNEYQTQLNTPKPASKWEKMRAFLQSNLGKPALAWAGVVILLVFSGYWVINSLDNQALVGQNEMTLQKEPQPNIPKTELQTTEPNAQENDLVPENKANEQKYTDKTEPKTDLAVVSEPILMERSHSNLDILRDEVIVNRSFIASGAPARLISPEPAKLNPSTLDIPNSSGILLADFTIQKTETDIRLQTIRELIDKPNVPEAVSQLLNILNTDPSPHVRMLAIEALEYYADNEEVRQQVLAGLNKQDSPYLQLATIDWIVKYDLKTATQSLKDLLNQSTLNPLVREQAEIALENM
ncbi:MAG: HEAT repeat domain-containing protein [Microscillaceae bacterium]|jgi:hypothetical protein|nr:HEAT repeat domain-containing protein [Microscillaceae bacterium]